VKFFDLSDRKDELKNNSCFSCGLHRNCLSPKMKPYGSFNKKIMVVGEAPGEEEDKKGKPWQGKVGSILRKVLLEYDIDLFKDCVCINSVMCRPENNKTPTDKEINCCRKNVLKAINDYKPKLIILVGGCSVNSVIGYIHNGNIGGITDWRGFVIPDKTFNSWLCPIFHPSFINRQNTDECLNIWKKDIENLLSYIDKSVIINQPNIEILDDKNAKSLLDSITDGVWAVDFEATGLKPHSKGHKILSIGLSNGDKVYAFDNIKSPVIFDSVKRFFMNSNIKKVAHNMKFENMWSMVYLGVPIKGLHFDTMQMAHILDNRRGITGLKLQTYINFGIPDWSKSVDYYMKADSKNSNSFNKLEEYMKTNEGRHNTLKYNGLDAFYTYKLYEKQLGEIINGKNKRSLRTFS
jgi:DNA polymerase